VCLKPDFCVQHKVLDTNVVLSDQCELETIVDSCLSNIQVDSNINIVSHPVSRLSSAISSEVLDEFSSSSLLFESNMNILSLLCNTHEMPVSLSSLNTDLNTTVVASPQLYDPLNSEINLVVENPVIPGLCGTGDMSVDPIGFVAPVSLLSAAVADFVPRDSAYTNTARASVSKGVTIDTVKPFFDSDSDSDSDFIYSTQKKYRYIQ
jgi:hypothetical protein